MEKMRKSEKKSKKDEKTGFGTQETECGRERVLNLELEMEN